MYHILPQSRIHTIMNCEDLYCSEHCTYNNVKVIHNLCSSGHFEWVDSGQETKFYEWVEDRQNRSLMVQFNNYDNIQIVSATLQLPLWDDESKCYKFENNISQCTRFRITKFNPIII